jgi:hypothetical protein
MNILYIMLHIHNIINIYVKYMKELNLIKYIDKIPQKKITLNEQSKQILNKMKTELKHIYNRLLHETGYNSEKLNHQFAKGELFDSIPVEIRNIIQGERININVRIYRWNMSIKGGNYNINLHINYANKTNKNIKYVVEKKLTEYYTLIRMIMEFLINHSENKLKMHNINIYLYLTKHIKLVPDKKSDIVSWINVNTGLTTFCHQHTEINIFRVEEWFKVFIHECIHNLCMDFGSTDLQSYVHRLKEIFIIDSDYLLFESYTELWAEIIQIVFLMVLDGGEMDINKRFTNEFVFSALQADKNFSICTGGKATYNDLINRNKEALKYYKEDSNCFSYYVLKTIALYNINDFLSWCFNKNGINIIQFNKKTENIVDFINFFDKKYRERELIDYINLLNRSNINKTKGSFIGETLRISIYEIIIQ